MEQPPQCYTLLLTPPEQQDLLCSDPPSASPAMNPALLLQLLSLPPPSHWFHWHLEME